MNGAQALIRTLVACGVDTCFMNPGHVGDALRRRARRRPRDAQRARAVRRRRDRRRRRLRPHGRPARRPRCCTSGPGSATASPTCTTRARARRRSSTSSATTRPTTSSTTRSSSPTSRRSRATSRASSAGRPRPTRSAATRPTPSRPRSARPARSRRSSCPPTSRGARAASRRRRVAPPRARPPATTRFARSPRRCARASRPCCSSAAPRAASRRWPLARAIADATGAKLLCETFPARIERGAGRVAGRPHRLPRRVRGDAARRRCATSCSSTPRRRCRSSPIPTRRAGWRPTAARSTRSPGPADDAPAALDALADALGAPDRRRPRASRSRGPSCRPARSPRRPCARRSARCCPRARSSPTRATRRGCSPPGATAGAPPPRLAVPHRRRDRPGPARSRSAPRSRAPTAGSSRSSPTAARCTRCSRCGRMAREGLDVTTILFNNGSYAVLNMELGRVGAEAAGPRAKAMLDIRRPDLDFVALGAGHGRARDARDHRRGVQRAARTRARDPGPDARRGGRAVDRLRRGRVAGCGHDD